MTIFTALGVLVELYLWLVMFPTAILSWFRIQPGTPLARIRYYLYRATEPLLRPVRRIIPPVGGLDLSFIVVFLVLQYVILRILFR